MNPNSEDAYERKNNPKTPEPKSAFGCVTVGQLKKELEKFHDSYFVFLCRSSNGIDAKNNYSEIDDIFSQPFSDGSEKKSCVVIYPGEWVKDSRVK